MGAMARHQEHFGRSARCRIMFYWSMLAGLATMVVAAIVNYLVG
jgi:hypothetical protein